VHLTEPLDNVHCVRITSPNRFLSRIDYPSIKCDGIQDDLLKSLENIIIIIVVLLKSSALLTRFFHIISSFSKQNVLRNLLLPPSSVWPSYMRQRLASKTLVMMAGFHCPTISSARMLVTKHQSLAWRCIIWRSSRLQDIQFTRATSCDKHKMSYATGTGRHSHQIYFGNRFGL